jgi:UDP-N-acetylmuramate dehydrogenase
MEDLKLALAMVNQAGVSSMVLGNGSNTLFKDSGYDGIVIQLGDYFNQMSVIPTMAGQSSDEETPVLVFSGAAMLMSSLAKFLLRENLTGFEFASGIPGSVGGAAFMNAGAYGGEMKDILVCAHGVSRDGSIEKIFTAEELELSYRHSVLMESGDIITGVMLRLQRGNHQEISVKMKELAEKRNSKQPVQYPSAGSTFKRPEGYFAGKLIEDADLKGVSVGGAQVSTLHSGFVINRGGATATDILDVITLVQNTVYDRFGVKLEPEVRIVG